GKKISFVAVNLDPLSGRPNQIFFPLRSLDRETYSCARVSICTFSIKSGAIKRIAYWPLSSLFLFLWKGGSFIHERWTTSLCTIAKSACLERSRCTFSFDPSVPTTTTSRPWLFPALLIASPTFQ